MDIKKFFYNWRYKVGNVSRDQIHGLYQMYGLYNKKESQKNKKRGNYNKMPGYINIGNRYNDWNSYDFNGKEFQVLNPRQMFLDLIKYKQMPNEWDLKTLIFIGGQNSGKTVLIRYLVHLIRSVPSYRGITSVLQTNDLRIVGDKRYAKYFEDKKVIVLIIDDAIREGVDSRRAMSGSNVSVTREYCNTRHVLEDNYEPNGIIFMIFATQIYSRIDPTIRDPAQLKIFCDYYDQDWFYKIFTPEQAEVLRIASYEGMFSSNFDARRFALARTKSGDVATLEIPFSTKAEVFYPVIDRTIDKEVVINKLSKLILNEIDSLGLELKDVSNGALKGFLELESKQIEKDYYIKLNKGHFTSAINRAKWTLQLQESRSEATIEILNPNKMSARDRIVGLMQYEKPIFTIKELSERLTDITYNNISTTLSQDTTRFKNIARGTYCLKNYDLTQLEREKYCQDKYVKKILIMS